MSIVKDIVLESTNYELAVPVTAKQSNEELTLSVIFQAEDDCEAKMLSVDILNIWLGSNVNHPKRYASLNNSDEGSFVAQLNW
jgi:hypothetical protein